MRKCKTVIVVKVEHNSKKRKLMLCHEGAKIKAGKFYA